MREGPHIVFAPAFGVTQDEVLSKLRGKDKIKISPRSTLVIEGEGKAAPAHARLGRGLLSHRL